MVGIFSEDGKIDNVKIIGRTNEVFDKEAERVVKSIPQWDVFYRLLQFLQSRTKTENSCLNHKIDPSILTHEGKSNIKGRYNNYL
jgi:hypothetical protein